jgi:hypothetical protein
MTGFTFPGMMEEPAWTLLGSRISPAAANHRKSPQIFTRFAAWAFKNARHLHKGVCVGGGVHECFRPERGAGPVIIPQFLGHAKNVIAGRRETRPDRRAAQG